ncbi:dihydroxyacetone kinase subunit DhaL [Citrobacter koseri]|uniref:Dihydroxyacetone kinase subunit DhaL n=1 Tax=Citrobacter koseri TaxID=545 RepID=A0A2X2VKP6_CITKO|nr:dihydroxyacetone kinase subunit DhaL [Citrobacter koseri]
MARCSARSSFAPAQVTQAHQSLTLDELYQMMREGAEGVTSRGKAEPGDKNHV